MSSHVSLADSGQGQKLFNQCMIRFQLVKRLLFQHILAKIFSVGELR